MKDLISVIIPIYNSEKYLKECIESVLNQTYKNLEIILVNDGSTDNSLEICEEIKEKDQRIIIIDKKNTGVSDSRNIGIETSKGKYIVFVDSDDIIENNMIQILYDEALKHDVDVVRCNYQEYDSKNKGNIYDLENQKFEKEEIKKIIPYFITNKKNIPSYVWLLLIKKDKIVKFDTTLYFMEDTEFFIRLLLDIESIYFSNKYLYYYRYNTQSASKSSAKVTANILGILNSEEKIKESLRENGLLDESLERKMNATIFTLIISKIKLLSNKEMNNKEIKCLLKTKEINLILNNIEKQEIPKKIVIEYVLLKNKLFNICFEILKLKKRLKRK